MFTESGPWPLIILSLALIFLGNMFVKATDMLTRVWLRTAAVS